MATPRSIPALHPRLTREFLLRQRACPLHYDGDDTLVIAVAEHHHRDAVDAIARLASRQPSTKVLPDSELDQLIERCSTAQDSEAPSETDEEAELSLEDLRELANQPPVARYVNLLLRDAFDLGASDVHLEATRGGLVSRVRVDGVLREAPPAPRTLHFAIISRLKAMASLDVTERRLLGPDVRQDPTARSGAPHHPSTTNPTTVTPHSSSIPGSANRSHRPYGTPALSSIASIAPLVGDTKSIITPPPW